MKIQRFDGGLNTRPEPQFIKLEEATVFENIDNGSMVLKPLKDRAADGVSASRHAIYYDAQDQLVSNSAYESYVEFQKILYSANNNASPKKYNGTTSHSLGIYRPVLTPQITSNHGLKPPTAVQIDSDILGDLPNYTPKYLIVNTDDKYASTPLAVEYDLYKNLANEYEPDPYLEEQDPYAQYDANEEQADYYDSIENRSLTFTGIQVEEFGSNGVQLYRLYADVYYLVGAAFSASDVITDDVYDISANAVYDDVRPPIDARLQYVYTFVNSEDGTESAPSPLSDEVVVLGTAVLTNLQVSNDPQVDKKRLYRIGQDITAFSLIAELNNTDTTFDDSVHQTEIIGTVLSSYNNIPPPPDINYLAEANAMLFGTSGSQLHFTDIGEPDYWSVFNFLKFSSELTGIAPVANGILVFTKYKTYIVNGTSPNSLSQAVLSADQGCIAPSSIQYIGGAALWVSSDGICTSDGGYVRVLSKNKLGKTSINPIGSVIFDEVYYIVESSSSILALDVRYGEIYRRLDLGVDGLVVVDDELLGHSNSVMYKLFNSQDSVRFKYKSPRFIEGSITQEKTYKKVYIYSEGDIIVKIYIDKTLVLTKTLATTGNHQLQVPHDKQRGHYFEIELEGTGTVHEYEYVTGKKKNE